MPIVLPLAPAALASVAELIAAAAPTTERRRQLLELSGLSAFERKVDLEGASLDVAFRLIEALQWRNEGETAPPALSALLSHLEDYYAGQPETLAFLQHVAETPPAEQSRPLPLDPTLACPIQYTIPEIFAGRDEALATLLPRLLPQRTVVLQGNAGTGKTALAFAAAHQLHQSGAVCSVLYADITPSPDPATLLRGWASVAGMELDFTTNSPAQLALLLKDRLTLMIRRACTGNARVLVLIDNVFDNGIESVNLLKSASPPGATWLVATHSEAVADALDAPLFALDYFDRTQGIHFLRAYLAEEPEKGLDALEPGLGELSETLGGHALALKLAIARIKKEARRPGNSLESALDRLLPLYREGLSAGSPLESLGLDASHPAFRELKTHSLSHSFRLTYEELADTPPAQACFRTMGVLAYGAPVDVDLLAALWERDAEEASRITELLSAAAMLDRTERPGWYRLHPLLRTYARALLTESGEYDQTFDRYATLLTGFLGVLESHELLEEWADLAAYLPHITAVGDTLAATPARSGEEQELRFAFAVHVAQWLALRRDMHRPTWLEMGRTSASALGHPESRLLFTNHLMSYYARVGNRAKAEALQQEAFTLAQTVTDPEILIQTYYHAALAAVAGGDLPSAMKLLEQILPNLDKSSNRYTAGNVGLLLGLVLMAQGSPVQARYYLELAIPELKESGDRLGETDALLMLAQIYALLGQPDQVIQRAQEAADLYGAMGLDFNVAGAQLPIGEAYLQKGEAQRAYDILADALPRLRHTQDANIELRAISSMGFACAQMGDLDQGFALARQALDMAERLGNADQTGNAYILLGHLYSRQGDAEQGLAQFDRAYETLYGKGYVMLAGLAALHAGGVAADHGKNDAAEQYLRRATDHLLDTGAVQGVIAAQRLVGILKARGEDADVDDFLFARWLAIMERVRDALGGSQKARDELREELAGRREMLEGLVGEADVIVPLLDGLIALLSGQKAAPLPNNHPLARQFNALVKGAARGRPRKAKRS